MHSETATAATAYCRQRKARLHVAQDEGMRASVGLRKPHVHGSVYHGSFGRLVPEAMLARAAVTRTPVVRLAVVEHLDLGGVPRRDRREEPGAGDRSVGSGPAVEHDQGVRTARARPQELLACDAVAPSPFLLRGFWAMSFKLMAQKPQSRRGEG